MDPMIGRMCKRIIDYCRSVYIEKQINTILEKKGIQITMNENGMERGFHNDE